MGTAMLKFALSKGLAAARRQTTQAALPLLNGFPPQQLRFTQSVHHVAANGAKSGQPPLAMLSSKLRLSTTTGVLKQHPYITDSHDPTPYMIHNPVYSKAAATEIEPCHRPPETFRDKVAHALVTVLRASFDKLTGYHHKYPQTEEQWLRRFIFLETTAGIPGMVAGILRHMGALRNMERDAGWIKTLLEEAENERMHLMTFLQIRKPSLFMRFAVLATQGVFFNLFFLAYILSPKTCHRFVGHLEEEAVRTYTHAINDLDAGKLPKWTNLKGPTIAIQYWQMPEDATLRDVLLAIRADEAAHSHVNHTFASMDHQETNPFSHDSELPKDFTSPPPPK